MLKALQESTKRLTRKTRAMGKSGRGTQKNNTIKKGNEK
jgi:hypothetical protein